MHNLSFDQQIQLGAATTFAKLASGESYTRSRRRREQYICTSLSSRANSSSREVGERRRHQPSTGALAHGSKASANQTPFTHIQVISKTPKEEPSLKQETRKQGFHKSSLMQDPVATQEPPSASNIFKSPESLAKNTQGATFAAKARAAELRAARSRAEKQQVASSASAPAALQRNTMAFRAKNKGGSRQWKRINLNDLPGTGEYDGDSSEGHNQDSEGDFSILTNSKSTDNESMKGSFNRASAYMPTLAEAMGSFPRSSHAAKALPSPEPIVQSIETDEDLHFDRKCRTRVPAQVNARGTGELCSVASHFFSGQEKFVELPSTATIHHEGYSADAGDRLNFYNNDHDLQNETNFFQNAIPVPGQSSAESGLNYITSETGYVYPANAYTNTPSDVNALIQDLPATSDISYQYTRPPHVPPLRSRPPHHYPAVKGTQGDIYRQSLRADLESLNYETSCIANEQPTDLDSPNDPSVYQNQTNTYKDGTLDLYHTNNFIFGSDNNEPFESQQSTSSTRSGTPTYEDLVNTSDPLPKTEPTYDLVSVSPVYWDGFPIFEGYQMHPEKVTRLPPPYDWQSNTIYMDIAGGRPFGHCNDRFNPELIAWMHNFVEQARAIRIGWQACEAEPQGHAQESFYEGRMNDTRYRSEDEKSKVKDLMFPALACLYSYVDDRGEGFNRWTRPAEWCIDQGPNGNKSFFGGDWGMPPRRLGRDPRYATRTSEPACHRRIAGGVAGITGYNAHPAGYERTSWDSSMKRNTEGFQ